MDVLSGSSKSSESDQIEKQVVSYVPQSRSRTQNITMNFFTDLLLPALRAVKRNFPKANAAVGTSCGNCAASPVNTVESKSRAVLFYVMRLVNLHKTVAVTSEHGTPSHSAMPILWYGIFPKI
jgi:hypothetical protein